MLAPAHLGKAALTLAAAAVLAAGLTTDAHAASGQIRYWNFAQDEVDIANPPDNVCINLQFHAWLVANDTDKTLSYFFGADCTNFTGNLDPGRAVANQSPLSVRIIG